MLKTQYVDSALLDEYIQKSGYKVGFVVEKLGISRQAYFKKKSGTVPFRASEVYVICDLLRIPKEEQDKIFCF